jgi:hypothetical protein
MSKIIITTFLRLFFLQSPMIIWKMSKQSLGFAKKKAEETSKARLWCSRCWNRARVVDLPCDDARTV